MPFEGITQQVNLQLDEYLKALYENKEINGNILVTNNGKIIYNKSFGFADFAKGIQQPDSCLTNIASISKTFTAVAVLQLKEKGKLKSDDPYSKYFNDFAYPTITSRNLLSHTSGVPDLEPHLDWQPGFWNSRDGCLCQPPTDTLKIFTKIFLLKKLKPNNCNNPTS